MLGPPGHRPVDRLSRRPAVPPGRRGACVRGKGGRRLLARLHQVPVAPRQDLDLPERVADLGDPVVVLRDGGAVGEARFRVLQRGLEHNLGLIAGDFYLSQRVREAFDVVRTLDRLPAGLLDRYPHRRLGRPRRLDGVHHLLAVRGLHRAPEDADHLVTLVARLEDGLVRLPVVLGAVLHEPDGDGRARIADRLDVELAREVVQLELHAAVVCLEVEGEGDLLELVPVLRSHDYEPNDVEVVRLLAVLVLALSLVIISQVQVRVDTFQADSCAIVVHGRFSIDDLVQLRPERVRVGGKRALHLGVDVHDDSNQHVEHDEVHQQHEGHEPDPRLESADAPHLFPVEVAHHDLEGRVEGPLRGGEHQELLPKQQHARDRVNEEHGEEHHREVEDVHGSLRQGLRHEREPGGVGANLEELEHHEEGVERNDAAKHVLPLHDAHGPREELVPLLIGLPAARNRHVGNLQDVVHALDSGEVDEPGGADEARVHDVEPVHHVAKGHVLLQASPASSVQSNVRVEVWDLVEGKLHHHDAPQYVPDVVRPRVVRLEEETDRLDHLVDVACSVHEEIDKGQRHGVEMGVVRGVNDLDLRRVRRQPDLVLELAELRPEVRLGGVRFQEHPRARVQVLRVVREERLLRLGLEHVVGLHSRHAVPAEEAPVEHLIGAALDRHVLLLHTGPTDDGMVVEVRVPLLPLGPQEALGPRGPGRLGLGAARIGVHVAVNAGSVRRAAEHVVVVATEPLERCLVTIAHGPHVGSHLVGIPGALGGEQQRNEAQIHPRPKVGDAVDVVHGLVAHAAVLVRHGAAECKVRVLLYVEDHSELLRVRLLQPHVRERAHAEEPEHQHGPNEA
mmetsp:Transcript_64346/g.182529  ORF Transcript_64346/g.182529 Transcript_64346/m.182529 type:complete len:849 (-) Transcript_64346:831-3377(-)